MRKLVTIRMISEIRPIPNADAIECACVEGWTVVIKKGQFRSGDLCVYFEIDSFLPLSDDRFGFLAGNRITWEDKEGVRLRTVKLRGQISQGLILPLSDFPEIEKVRNQHQGSEVDLRGIDFSGDIHVEKWEAPVPANLAGEIEGALPSFIAKTDQERIQNLPEILECPGSEDNLYEVTVKLDGSSMTVFHNGGKSGVCGRNWQYRETASNSLWRIARRDRLLEALERLGRNIALQGEIIGEGIQGNPEKLRGQEFRLFDVFDIDRYAYLGRTARQEVVTALMEAGATIKEVPYLGEVSLGQFKGEMSEILAFAEGPSLNPATTREGVVFKRLDGKQSFKVISNRYLLKHAYR
ncbi:MAG: RNA ligase (ATP) [Alphaproteobacteria bacterium]|nr:RNA ligase (ATP) [Alphaproteobacteria bacterium]